MKTCQLLALTAFSVTALLLVAFSSGEAVEQQRSGDVMALAASGFLETLTPVQQAKAVLSFEDPDRLNWEEAPGPRKGVSLRDLNEPQQALAMALLRTGVSDAGYEEIKMIISREPILSGLQRTQEGRNVRNPELYYFSIYGTPSATSPWGWRFEGHHISLNFTVVGKSVSNGPLFLGAQPAEIQEGGVFEINGQIERSTVPVAASRALASVEDRARDLVWALDDTQRSVAIFDRSEERTADMVSGIGTKTVRPLDPPGLFAREMTEAQKELLAHLVEAYLSHMPPDVAAERSRLLLGADLDRIAFAWSGGTERGQWHYYTVQGPTFLIEYAQARNNTTNHVHTVWRDFDGDFGLSLLGER